MWYNKCATQFNITYARSLRLVKTYALLVISLSDVNCVATEAKLRFSVRGFGYAPFYILLVKIGGIKNYGFNKMS